MISVGKTTFVEFFEQTPEGFSEIRFDHVASWHIGHAFAAGMRLGFESVWLKGFSGKKLKCI
jgi:hypothetical protein